MKKRIMIAITILIIMFSALSISASNPAVICKTDLPQNSIEAVESQSRGLYSSKLPLVPVCVLVEEVMKDRVFYTIYYFPFGKVEMSYSETDGYNIERPLLNS